MNVIATQNQAGSFTKHRTTKVYLTRVFRTGQNASFDAEKLASRH